MTDVTADDPEAGLDGVEINIDPSAKARGMAVISESEDVRKAHALIKLRHRGQSHEKKDG